MEIAFSGRVIARDSIGRFIAECERAATESIEDIIKDGESLAKDFAPVGHKADPRTVTLRQGMFHRMLSATSGEFGCRARHALPIELSAVPHEITGQVSFFWDAMGRPWVPGKNMIHHPGNAAQPYLRPAYAIVSGRAISIMRRHYPG